MAGEQLTETIVFIKNYASLCNTLTDINGLLPFFIQESIISFHDLEEVSAITTTQGKVGKLLAHIYGPLTAGDTTGFHKMLTIMKEHGSQATKDLAVKMMNSEMEVSSTKRELKDKQSEEKDLHINNQGGREDESLTKDQEKRAFQLAMRTGVSNSFNFRLCVFGPENSGKSCLVDTLCDDIFQEREATLGADVNVCTIYASDWQKCTAEQMAEKLKTQFFHDLNVSVKEQVKSSSFQASFKTRKQGILTKFKAVLLKPSQNDSSQIDRAPEVKPEEIKQAKAVKIISQNEFTAIVWDFSGQIQYLSTHTVFVRRNNVVFIVFKASCLLSDFIKTRLGDQDSASYSKPVTYFHVIHYWLQTITSVCHDTGGADHMSEFLPTAVLIATHIDEIIGDLKQAKKEIVAQLARELEGKPYAKHLAGNLPGVGLLEALEKFCIFLSNTDRDENVINLLKEIVLQISAPSMKEMHPLIYLKIEQELLVLRREVITTTQFHKVAVENGFMVDENSIEMKGALDHFHQKGVILHFPSIDSLKELVFLSPQWLEKLVAFLIVAHHYKPTGDKDDHSYRRLKHEGVLVGSFLEHSLQMFNTLHRVIGCEISFNQAIALLSKFGFIAEISNTTEFLEESHPWSEEEKRIFIVPSQLPEGKEEKRSKFIRGKHAWTIYFAFMDGFIPLTIFYQMIAACINWNESRKQNIVWLQKYEIMMVLNPDQYYSVNLCEEKSSIQVDIILGHSMKKSAKNRKHLVDFFQVMLENICHDLIPASSKPIPYIQCPHCDRVHLKLRNALEGRTLICNMIPIHNGYYQDLFREFQSTVPVSDKREQLNKGQQYSSEELKDMVSDKIENAIQDKGNEMAAKINVLLVTADIDEYYATLSYIKSPIIQHKHYIIGLFGFSYVALQRITDFQETIELVSKGKKVFCNLSAVFSLGVIYGVENKKIERLSVLISKTLSLYKPPNSITHWKNIMYLPSPINNHFESLLSDWHPDFKIANRLLEKPHCFFGNVLYGNEVTRDIIDKYPDADGIEIDDRGLFYKDVLDYNLNLMIIKAVCGSVNQEERDYYSTAAILAADCLHHILADQRMQKIFEKWLYNDKVTQRYLNQAKNFGLKTTLRHLTILIAGTEQVGKTCLLEILQGNDPPLKHDPTTARDSKKVEIATSKVEISKSTWKPVDRSNQIVEISKYLHNVRTHTTKCNTDEPLLGMMGNKGTTNSKKNTTASSNKDIIASNKSSILEKNVDAISKEPNHDHIHNKDSLEGQVLHDDKNSTKLNIYVVDEDLTASIDEKFLNCNDSDTILTTWNILSIIDTAGQPELIQLLPAINKLSKITFIVFNMESKLENQVKRYDHESNSHIELHYSNSNVIECLMSMVSCSAQFIGLNKKYRDDNDKFQVCLVGTHYDRVYNKKILLAEMHEKINKLVSKTKLNEACNLWSLYGNCMFEIDTGKKYINAEKNENEIATASINVINEIRKKVEEVLQKGTKHIDIDISLNWFLLELLIEEECTKNNKFYMKRDMVNNLIQKQNMKMSDKEINLALKYLHRTGVLLYFLPEENERLSYHVFSDPNWLFQQLTALVNVIHSRSTQSDKHVKDLKFEGKLHMSLVKDKFKDIEVDLLLALLEHMKIIAEMHQQNSYAGNKIYFMPCVLPLMNLNGLGTTMNTKVAPLHIKSQFGTIPRGVFCCLVVALLEGKNIFNETVGKLYNNLITFQTTTENITVELRDRIFSFEIMISCENDQHFIYHQVQHHLTCALTDVWKKFEFSNLETAQTKEELSSFIEYGFICKHCKDNVTTVCGSNLKCDKDEYKCEKRGILLPLQREHKIWFAYKPFFKAIGCTSNTLTFQWNSPMLTKEVHFSLWYCIISKDGIREETKKEKKLSAEDLLLNNGLATYKVYELISNTKYQFELAVINKRLGIEGEHVELIASTAPPVPLDLKVTSTHNTIFLSWKLPPSSSTSSIKYILEWKKVIEQSFSHVQNITATNFEVDELIPNTEYQFQVAAVDSGICGSFTDIVCQYTKPSEPDVYVDSRSITENSLTLIWKPLNPLHGSNFQYEVEIKKGYEEYKTLMKELSNYTSNYKISGLNPNTKYSFRISASNLAGRGPYKYTDQYTKPSKPEKLKVNQDKNYQQIVTVTWEKPNNGSADKYTVQYKEADRCFLSCDINHYTDELTYTVKNLIADKKYQFRVAAINEAGLGSFTDIQICHIKSLISEDELVKMVPNQDNTFMKNNEKLAKKSIEETNILIITANDIEYRAVLHFLKPRNQEPGSNIYWYCHKFKIGFIERNLQCVFGKFGDFNAAVHKMPNQGPAAAQSTVIAASMCYEHLEAIFAVGVACGVEGKSDILDVIVAKEVTFYTDARLSTTKAGGLEIEPRSSARLKKSSKFIQYFLQEPKWTTTTSELKNHLIKQPRMHTKEILSGNYLIDNLKMKNKLIENFAPKAYGLEMECAGLFYDHDKHNVELMLVKAVCDLGDGKKNKDYQPTAALLAAECVYHYLSKGEIKPEQFKYTAKNLNHSISDITEELRGDKCSLSENEAQQCCKKVKLLLMTTNDNEFNAVLCHMAKRHVEKRNLEDSNTLKSLILYNENDFDYFYIGEFADIPAALVKHQCSESYKISVIAIKNFCNLRAVIPVGVCGTFERIGDVIISSKIVVYKNNKVNKSVLTSQSLMRHLKTPGDWIFNCFSSGSPIKQLSQIYDKPFLSPDISEACQMFGDEIRDLCEDAMVFDMEGSGIANALNEHKHIDFIIVKAGGYASTNERKVESASEKEYRSAWEPVAAMAAANFLHSKLDHQLCRAWFKGKKPHDDLSVESPDTI